MEHLRVYAFPFKNVIDIFPGGIKPFCKFHHF